jgi:hypothetical protein
VSELKPCPFCGGLGVIEEVDVTGIYDRELVIKYSPGCNNQECHGQWGWLEFDTKEEAIDKWNTRASDDFDRLLDSAEQAVKNPKSTAAQAVLANAVKYCRGGVE